MTHECLHFLSLFNLSDLPCVALRQFGDQVLQQRVPPLRNNYPVVELKGPRMTHTNRKSQVRLAQQRHQTPLTRHIHVRVNPPEQVEQLHAQKIRTQPRIQLFIQTHLSIHQLQILNTILCPYLYLFVIFLPHGKYLVSEKGRDWF